MQVISRGGFRTVAAQPQGLVPPLSLVPPPITGLSFLGNNVAGDDVMFVWTNASGNMLPREGSTQIWDQYYNNNTGYYANNWFSSNILSPFPGDTFDFGCHPYPSLAGAVDGTGQVTDGTSSAGTSHRFEIAGLNAHDYLCSPGGSGGLLVVKGQWYRHMVTTEIVTVSTANDTLRHKFWPDMLGNPSFVIVQDVARPIANPSNKFYLKGCSPWRSGQGTAGATSSDECPAGIQRNYIDFRATLLFSEGLLEGADLYNRAVTPAGIASLHYVNRNPTPSDISDKSGNGRHPAWVNSNRPGLYTA